VIRILRAFRSGCAPIPCRLADHVDVVLDRDGDSGKGQARQVFPLRQLLGFGCGSLGAHDLERADVVVQPPDLSHVLGNDGSWIERPRAHAFRDLGCRRADQPSSCLRHLANLRESEMQGRRDPSLVSGGVSTVDGDAVDETARAVFDLDDESTPLEVIVTEVDRE
jgi:hypothetical protein